ncbi:recombinase family protein [Mesorhizobium sp. M0208]
MAEAIGYVREGDTPTVWKLDRLGRSMKHLIEIITELERRRLPIHNRNIDITPSGGRLVFHLFGEPRSFALMSLVPTAIRNLPTFHNLDGSMSGLLSEKRVVEIIRHSAAALQNKIRVRSIGE